MLHRVAVSVIMIAASALAMDLAEIPFSDATGKQVSLQDHARKVILVVNVASKCGLTAQYPALEALFQKHKHQGFVVIGFPCNDFGNQEPGTTLEIQQFCKSTYGVSFPIMGKLSVKGANQHQLYQFLTGKDSAFPGEVRWNFGKFLISRDGKPIARFEPPTNPDSPEIAEALAKALAMPEN